MWKDTTSYSRDKERIPTTWSLDRGGLHITVTSSHLYHPGEWVMHCDPWFHTRPLVAETKEEAQAAALDLVTKKVNSLHAAFAA